MADKIVSTLAKEIAENILNQPNREIKIDEPIISSGMIDSFHLVDLALFVEDTFGVVIDDSELNADNFDTLKQLLEIISARQD